MPKKSRKKLVAIRLSDLACSILKEQPNKTKFVEEAILLKAHRVNVILKNSELRELQEFPELIKNPCIFRKVAGGIEFCVRKGSFPNYTKKPPPYSVSYINNNKVSETTCKNCKEDLEYNESKQRQKYAAQGNTSYDGKPISVPFKGSLGESEYVSSWRE